MHIERETHTEIQRQRQKTRRANKRTIQRNSAVVVDRLYTRATSIYWAQEKERDVYDATVLRRVGMKMLQVYTTDYDKSCAVRAVYKMKCI